MAKVLFLENGLLECSLKCKWMPLCCWLFDPYSYFVLFDMIRKVSQAPSAGGVDTSRASPAPDFK